ncbi:hypothetical protein DAERI_270017 [Deinococcus aerius]|uniref:Uncharacterized protein n=1 Tax=Deinococcus aerius TaxID=200253 RepID=A0A2I9D0Z8_9DEIO|nr:hypothetical protein [Deinococcus aerius]GBF08243.1 hypothetical protein DAERI_270017 [Deinococcus aerius]
MTDHKTGENAALSDEAQNEVVQETMQGGEGEMDANGLGKNFDREEKLGELRENLQGMASPAEGTADQP